MSITENEVADANDNLGGLLWIRPDHTGLKERRSTSQLPMTPMFFALVFAVLAVAFAVVIGLTAALVALLP